MFGLVLATSAAALVACNDGSGDQNNNNINNNPNYLEYFVESLTYDASSDEIEVLGVMRPHGWVRDNCELGASELRHRFRFGQNDGIPWMEVHPISDVEFETRSRDATRLVDTTIPGLGTLRIIGEAAGMTDMGRDTLLSCADIVYNGQNWPTWPDRPFLFCGACEPQMCGDGVCDPREYDSCTADCGPVCTGTCGDGVTSCGEECDDANNVSGDGCDANCFLE